MIFLGRVMLLLIISFMRIIWFLTNQGLVLGCAGCIKIAFNLLAQPHISIQDQMGFVNFILQFIVNFIFLSSGKFDLRPIMWVFKVSFLSRWIPRYFTISVVADFWACQIIKSETDMAKFAPNNFNWSLF